MIEIIKEIAECNQDTCKDCKNICDYYSAITSFCEKVLPEGSVVLSKEEYEGLQMAKDFNYGYHEGTKNMEAYYENIRIPETRKETAKEILSLAIKHDDGYETDMPRFIDDLKKQYGVEVEE